MTRQRKVILEEIRKTDSHPTADELYQRVRQRLPHVSLGTIYRNLETLAASGLIQKLEMGGSQKRFDGNLY
jgi:Fur family ferric uptake transcriptional regulator